MAYKIKKKKKQTAKCGTVMLNGNTYANNIEYVSFDGELEKGGKKHCQANYIIV